MFFYSPSSTIGFPAYYANFNQGLMFVNGSTLSHAGDFRNSFFPSSYSGLTFTIPQDPPGIYMFHSQYGCKRWPQSQGGSIQDVNFGLNSSGFFLLPGAVYVDPSNSSRLYAGGYDGGVSGFISLINLPGSSSAPIQVFNLGAGNSFSFLGVHNTQITTIRSNAIRINQKSNLTLIHNEVVNNIKQSIFINNSSTAYVTTFGGNNVIRSYNTNTGGAVITPIFTINNIKED
jgi:hypothetical protein